MLLSWKKWAHLSVATEHLMGKIQNKEPIMEDNNDGAIALLVLFRIPCCARCLSVAVFQVRAGDLECRMHDKFGVCP